MRLGRDPGESQPPVDTGRVGGLIGFSRKCRGFGSWAELEGERERENIGGAEVGAGWMGQATGQASRRREQPGHPQMLEQRCLMLSLKSSWAAVTEIHSQRGFQATETYISLFRSWKSKVKVPAVLFS